MSQQELHKQERNRQWAAMWSELTAQGWKTIALWPKADLVPGFCPQHNQEAPRLLLHPAHAGRPRGLVLICAGGGFRYKTYLEATASADYFYSAGMNVAILDYRCLPYDRADALCDAKRAVRMLRKNAPEYGIDPDHIALCGFSAGGMISAMAATLFDPGDPLASDPVEQISCRPDAAVICYGAMCPAQSYGSLGYDREAQNQLAKLSPDQNVPFDAPPFFIFQTAKDDPRHCLKLASALAERGIALEVHLFKDGSHGQALYDGQNGTENIPHTAQWAALACQWLIEYGF